MRIYTNTLAQSTQKNLLSSQKSLGAAIERISSGLRINQAADDAAGLSISNRMESRIRGKDQALNNLNDGISMLKTVDSGLDAINSNVLRIRDLAVQMENDTYSLSDKNAIELEIKQRLLDIERLGKSINFNGQNLANEYRTMSLQIGESATDSLDIDLKALNLQTLGLDTSVPPIGPAITPENPLILPPGSVWTRTGEDISGPWGNISKIQILYNHFNEVSQKWGSKLMDAEPYYGVPITAHPILDKDGNYDPNMGIVIKVGDTYYSQFPEKATYSNFDHATNSFVVQIEDSFGAVRPGAARNAVIFDEATGKSETYNFSQQRAGFDSNGNFVDYVTYTDAAGIEYHIPFADMSKGMTINSSTGQNLSAHAVHLGHPNYIEAADDAIGRIGEYRSYIGAMMNRMDSIGNGLVSGSNDLRAAQSRIQDADYAVEISNMTRGQILQQAGQAVLAQANQIPHGVLSLLQR